MNGKRRKYDELLSENSPCLQTRRRKKRVIGEKISAVLRGKATEKLLGRNVRGDNVDSLGSIGKCLSLLRPESSTSNEMLRKPRGKRGMKCRIMNNNSELEQRRRLDPAESR
jgi:hypothetical protein